MNAQCSTIPQPSDAALVARWTLQADTGADTFSVAELDRLAALTPANDRRAQAEIADVRAIEVELLGYDPTVDADDIDDDCRACHGTGLGTRDGACCSACGGRGYDRGAISDPDPYDLDDERFDDYLVGSYAAAVA